MERADMGECWCEMKVKTTHGDRAEGQKRLKKCGTNEGPKLRWALRFHHSVQCRCHAPPCAGFSCRWDPPVALSSPSTVNDTVMGGREAQWGGKAMQHNQCSQGLAQSWRSIREEQRQQNWGEDVHLAQMFSVTSSYHCSLSSLPIDFTNPVLGFKNLLWATFRIRLLLHGFWREHTKQRESQGTISAHRSMGRRATAKYRSQLLHNRAEKSEGSSDRTNPAAQTLSERFM